MPTIGACVLLDRALILVALVQSRRERLHPQRLLWRRGIVGAAGGWAGAGVVCTAGRGCGLGLGLGHWRGRACTVRPGGTAVWGPKILHLSAGGPRTIGPAWGPGLLRVIVRGQCTGAGMDRCCKVHKGTVHAQAGWGRALRQRQHRKRRKQGGLA